MKHYKFNKETLQYTEDTELIKKIHKSSIVVLAILLVLIGIAIHTTNKSKQNRIATIEAYERILALTDSIADQNYTQSEMLLYSEIGKQMISRRCEPMNKENICNYIDTLASYGIVWYPDIIKANCKCESGFGASQVAKKYNNIFGMDHPNVRRTLSTRQSGGRFATYNNWKCAVLDRVLWDYATFKKIPSRKAYLDMMTKKYNTENPEYGQLLAMCMMPRSRR